MDTWICLHEMACSRVFGILHGYCRHNMQDMQVVSWGIRILKIPLFPLVSLSGWTGSWRRTAQGYCQRHRPCSLHHGTPHPGDTGHMVHQEYQDVQVRVHTFTIYWLSGVHECARCKEVHRKMLPNAPKVVSSWQLKHVYLYIYIHICIYKKITIIITIIII